MAFSAEQAAEHYDFTRKKNAGSAKRTAKGPSTLVET